jgi:hypothetical protein
MSYQGHEVNFSQSSSFERAIGMEIGNINTALYTYPQLKNTASAKSDTDIWNHLNRYVWGKSGSESSPRGNWSADPNAIVPNIQKNTNAIQQLDTAVRQIISQGTGSGMTRQQVEGIVEEYHGDDIALLHKNTISLGNSQQAAKTQRDSMEAKIKSNKDEHSDFHTKLTNLGISLKDHSHNQGGGGIMSYLPLIAVGGLAVYLLKRKK